MHSESSGFARTWPSLPMSPELSGVVRAFRTAPAPEASRPLASGSLVVAFAQGVGDSLTSARIRKSHRHHLTRFHASSLMRSRIWKALWCGDGHDARALTPPHIRKAHALSHPEPHAPSHPEASRADAKVWAGAASRPSRPLEAHAFPRKSLMRFSQKQPQAAGESSETPAACTSFEAPRFSNGSRRSV